MVKGAHTNPGCKAFGLQDLGAHTIVGVAGLLVAVDVLEQRAQGRHGLLLRRLVAQRHCVGVEEELAVGGPVARLVARVAEHTLAHPPADQVVHQLQL